MNALTVEQEMQIHASAERVWSILTDSLYIRQYMFGCIAESDWKPGSSLLWKGATDGHLYVKGRVVAIDAPRRLEYTVMGADTELADVPENYLTTVYAIKPRSDGSVYLKLSMADFNSVAEGKKRYEDMMAGGGWKSILMKVKELAENA